MSEENINGLSREHVRKFLRIESDTALKQMSDQQWLTACKAALNRTEEKLALGAMISIDVDGRQSYQIWDDMQLKELEDFLKRYDDKNARELYAAQADPPYEDLRTVARNQTAAAQQPVNNQVIMNYDSPIHVGGTYQYDDFKKNFYDKLTPEQKELCKEQRFKSFEELKNSDLYKNDMDDQQRQYYQNVKAGDYPIGLFIMKSSDKDLQDKFTAAADSAKNMEVPFLYRPVAEVEKMFRPGR